MNCKTKWVGWMFHKWNEVVHYPPALSDGAGGCWAGHVVETCEDCGAKHSCGIWAASETIKGKSWSFMRNANSDELKEQGLS